MKFRLAMLPVLAGLTTAFAPITALPANPHPGFDTEKLAAAVETARTLPRLKALIIGRHGRIAFQQSFRGPSLNTPTNVKSVSKSILSSLVGIAVDKGFLTGADQKFTPILTKHLPDQAESLVAQVTLGQFLSMQSGLSRTSGRNYGRWVASKDWVRYVLTQPFAGQPGGCMLYSTGNYHVLSALLTKVSGKSTHELARDWLGKPLGIRIPPWEKDPNGIYLGGNNMAVSPRGLWRFGEMYRNGGVHKETRVVSEQWIKASWTPRTRSRFTHDPYGYGWFRTDVAGYQAYYARGLGGQYIYILPGLEMTIVLTSDPTKHTRIGNYRWALAELVDKLAGAAMGPAPENTSRDEREPNHNCGY